MARKSSRAEVLERRLKILDLKLRGESTTALAKQFNITSRQVRMDLANIRSEMGKTISWEELKSKIFDYDEKARMRIKRLWYIIANKDSTQDEQIRALNLLRKEDEKAIKLEKDVGILPKDPSPLISVESKSEEGDAENKVVVNVIMPPGTPKLDDKGNPIEESSDSESDEEEDKEDE